MEFPDCIPHILKFEGGLVDHPKDPGLITKFGISLRSYPMLGEDGIRALTKEDAKVLYKRDYWDKMRCDDLPSGLRLMAFDCAVNQGVSYARRSLQAALSVKTDGVIGPKTIAAAHKVSLSRSVHRFSVNRYSRYRLNKNWETFGDGWMSRLLSVTMLTLQGEKHV